MWGPPARGLGGLNRMFFNMGPTRSICMTRPQPVAFFQWDKETRGRSKPGTRPSEVESEHFQHLPVWCSVLSQYGTGYSNILLHYCTIVLYTTILPQGQPVRFSHFCGSRNWQPLMSRQHPCSDLVGLEQFQGCWISSSAVDALERDWGAFGLVILT